MTVRHFVALLPLLLPTSAAATNQVLLRYLDIGYQGSARLLTADKAGNLFTVSTITDPSGRPQMRAIKMDAKGNPLASIDFGGSGFDRPEAAATDAQGNLVVVGTAVSADFPSVAPLFSPNGSGGAFVMKLDSQLHAILFSTLLSNQAAASAVALDAAGNIFLAGNTTDPNFPLTPGAYRTKPPVTACCGWPYSSALGFLTEISPNGDHLLYSTYFGGDYVTCLGGSRCVNVFSITEPLGLAVGPSGTVAMAGVTTASDLPTTPGVFGPTCNCSNLFQSGFLAVFSPGATQALVWSTFLNVTGGSLGIPGTPSIGIGSLAFDAAGNLVVGGSAAQGLSTTAGTIQPDSLGSGYGAFLAKVSSTGTSLLWCTYFGGGGAGATGGVGALAVDAQGRIVITGSSDPSLLPPFSGIPLLGTSYVARLSADASTLQDLYVGPANAAGSGLVLTSTGSFVSLGQPGSLWIQTTTSGPSLLGVANAASGPVSGVVSPVELVSLYGIGIGPQNPLPGQVQNGVYTSSLGGYQVLFDGTPAPLLYVGPTQINTIIPSVVYLHDFTHVQIVTPTGTIDGPTLALLPAVPDIFQNNATGLAAALNQDGSINSLQNPAKPGSIVTIFATGGETYAWRDGTVVPINAPVGTNLPVSVLLGLTSLEVLYAGDAPGIVAGVMQINFRLPDALPVLDTFQVTLQIAGTTGGQGLIAVAN
ncbi:MAG: hypothetical protein ABSB88_01275 [Bryobacteraceae bacterium]|jgi:uncharacterized protein (TIGR03437 family)